MNGRHVRDATRSAESAGRLLWIDTARGLAIVLVVLIHATDWIQETTIRIPLWDDVNEVLSTLRMPLFFACAGILAAKWLQAGWADLLSRKVSFLLWVYLLWQPIGSLAALVAARFTGDELTAVRMLGSLALSPLRPRFELWFLWSLVLFFVLARALIRVPVPLQLAVTAAGSAIWFSSLIPETNLGWDGSVKYFVFFLIGAHYRSVLTGFAERIGMPASLVLIGGWLALSAGAYTSGLDRFVGVGLLVRLVGVAAGIALAVRWQSIGVFGYLGSRTLPIYLAHTPLIICFTWVLSTLLGAGRLPTLVEGLLPLLFVAAAVPLALLLHAALAGNAVGGLLYRPPAAVIAVVRWLFTRHRPAPQAQVVALATLVPLVPPAPLMIDLRGQERATADGGLNSERHR